jgi:DNA replication protein DnaC
MRRSVDDLLASPPREDLSRPEWLWRLLEPQVRERLEGRIERRIRESRLPARKTLESFDFDFQPKLDRDLVLELATLRFLDQGLNVLLAGMSGTGKSHLAMALALAACADNRRVRYTTSAQMLSTLNAALADGSLETVLSQYVRPDLLVVDEVGLEQVERSVASRAGLMQKVLLPRHEHRSTIVTSNIPWESWGEYLGDHLGAGALLDRLVHHSHVIVINGPSYRDHEHKKDVKQKRQAAASVPPEGDGRPPRVRK